MGLKVHELIALDERTEYLRKLYASQCGEESPKGVACDLKKNHSGKHSWERA